MSNPRDTARQAFALLHSPRFFRAVNRALYVGADMVRTEAHRSISAGSVSGKHHQPSPPGSPPNRDGGTLQAHIETSQPAPYVARVTSSAPYAAVHEFGGSKHPQRAYIRPARDKMKPKVARLLVSEINKAKRGR
jgi:phage gpG-like protein